MVIYYQEEKNVGNTDVELAHELFRLMSRDFFVPSKKNKSTRTI